MILKNPCLEKIQPFLRRTAKDLKNIGLTSTLKKDEHAFILGAGVPPGSTNQKPYYDSGIDLLKKSNIQDVKKIVGATLRAELWWWQGPGSAWCGPSGDGMELILNKDPNLDRITVKPRSIEKEENKMVKENDCSVGNECYEKDSYPAYSKVFNQLKSSAARIEKHVWFSHTDIVTLADKRLRNREARDKGIIDYRSAMDNGKWDLGWAAEPILISPEGRLLGGQHRMLAAKGSKKVKEMGGIVFKVVLNASEEDANRQNGSIPHTKADRFQLNTKVEINFNSIKLSPQKTLGSMHIAASADDGMIIQMNKKKFAECQGDIAEEYKPRLYELGNARACKPGKGKLGFYIAFNAALLFSYPKMPTQQWIDLIKDSEADSETMPENGPLHEIWDLITQQGHRDNEGVRYNHFLCCLQKFKEYNNPLGPKLSFSEIEKDSEIKKDIIAYWKD